MFSKKESQNLEHSKARLLEMLSLQTLHHNTIGYGIVGETIRNSKVQYDYSR